MSKFASLSSPSSRVRGQLQARLYYARKKNRQPNFGLVFALTLAESNDILIAGIRNAPTWFEQADFTLTFEDESTATFTWSTDHWALTDGTFASDSGIATLSQGDDTVPIRWSGAEVTP